MSITNVISTVDKPFKSKQFSSLKIPIDFDIDDFFFYIDESSRLQIGTI